MIIAGRKCQHSGQRQHGWSQQRICAAERFIKHLGRGGIGLNFQQKRDVVGDMLENAKQASGNSTNGAKEFLAFLLAFGLSLELAFVLSFVLFLSLPIVFLIKFPFPAKLASGHAPNAAAAFPAFPPLFNKPALFLGIPLLYAYIFAAWALLIALMAMVVGRAGR